MIEALMDIVLEPGLGQSGTSVSSNLARPSLFNSLVALNDTVQVLCIANPPNQTLHTRLLASEHVHGLLCPFK